MNEMMLLRDRREDLDAAGVRPFAISRDSPWSHAFWAMTLGVEGVPFLSDWNGDATRGFDVEVELLGMAGVAIRSAFLIEGDTVRASWLLGREMSDIDVVFAAALSLSR